MTPNESVLTYMQALHSEQFWGFITVKCENGIPVHLRREENLKPVSLATNRPLPETNRKTKNDNNN